MGILDSKQRPPAPATFSGPCPDPANHFLTEVNRGSLRVQTWQAHLNDMYRRGYRMTQAFEQDGNTVQVYEHHFHPVTP